MSAPSTPPDPQPTDPAGPEGLSHPHERGARPSTSSPFVTAAESVEDLTVLDPVVRAVRPLADALVAEPFRRDLLRGTWLGHALHPILTDVPTGLWTSAVVLDLVGGRGARRPAQRLVGLGVVSAVPTAVTGWAEWSGTGQREQRVGVVHAVSNVVASACSPRPGGPAARTGISPEWHSGWERPLRSGSAGSWAGTW